MPPTHGTYTRSETTMSNKSRDEAKRNQVELAKNNIITGKATEADYSVIRDGDLMSHSNLAQCYFMAKAPYDQIELPDDVFESIVGELLIRMWQSADIRKIILSQISAP